MLKILAVLFAARQRGVVDGAATPTETLFSVLISFQWNDFDTDMPILSNPRL
jgi:hypothetical protein